MPVAQQVLKPYPATAQYPAQPIRLSSHFYSSYSYPPSVPLPGTHSLPVSNTAVKHVAAEQAYQVHSSETTFFTTQVAGYSGANPLHPFANACVPNMTLHSPQVVLDHYYILCHLNKHQFHLPT